MNVIVTGSLSYDTIMDFPGKFADRIMPDKIHVLSLSFLVETLTKHIGGCATNLAYTLKLLGVDPFIMSAAGKDFGEMGKFFKLHKITTKGIKVFDHDYCGCYYVVTDSNDNQIGSFYPGASKHNKELSLNAIQGPALCGKDGPYENCKNFVTIGPTDPAAMVKCVNECILLRLPYLYDPSYQIAHFSPEELRKGIVGAEIVIGNDYEIALIEQRLSISHDELITMVPILITTLGPKGSVIETPTDVIHIQPANVSTVVDPTGAGDAYRGGFLAGFLHFSFLRGGLAEARPPLVKITKSCLRDPRRVTADDLQICGQMGSIAAAYTVEKYGTVTHTFTKKEFIKRYYNSYNTTLTLL